MGKSHLLVHEYDISSTVLHFPRQLNPRSSLPRGSHVASRATAAMLPILLADNIFHASQQGCQVHQLVNLVWSSVHRHLQLNGRSHRSCRLSPVTCHLPASIPRSHRNIAAFAQCSPNSVAYGALGLRERIKFIAVACPVYQLTTTATPEFASPHPAEASVTCRCGTCGTTVQASSRHQKYSGWTLCPGVRVNKPGSEQRSTVHSSTRDTLTFKVDL